MAFGASKPFSFGTSSTTPAAATGTATPPKFSFGNPAGSTATSSNSGSGSSSTAPAAFSFGSSTTQNTSAPATFGGFGSTQQQQPAAAGSSNLFGGFGNNNNAGTGASSLGFSFGAQNQNQQQNPQQQQQQQQQPALSFGNISKPPLTVSQLFPSSNPSLNASGAGSGFSLGASSSQPQSLSLGSSSMLGQSTTNNNHPANDAQVLAERIGAISNAWNPASFDNKFLFYLYNVSDAPLSTPLSSLPLPPQVAASPRLASLYKQAVLESPRPKDYLPVLASSFDDLQKRVEIQKSTSQAHLAKLKSNDVKGKIEQANKKHWNETIVRIERLSREQVKLEERLVRMCAKLAGLHPSPSSTSSSGSTSLSGSNAGSGSAKDDGELLIMLEHIRNELNGHSSTSRANGSSSSNNMKQMSRSMMGNTNRLANIVSELWMVVSQRKAALANNQRSGTPENHGEYRVQDQGELNKVLEVLAQQQKSLDYLSKAIRVLCVDIDTARNGFGLPWMFNDATSEGSRGMVMG